MPHLTIHPPFLRAGDRAFTVTTRVTAPPLFPSLPRVLWYRFPAEYQPYLGAHADGQVVALFLVAMAYGIDIEVRAPLSAQLWRGLNELQQKIVLLMPGDFQPITIHARELDDSTPSPAPDAVVSTFSGGADSFYTLWSHLPQNEPDPARRLTHGLFLQGHDILDTPNFEICRRAYETLYQRLGLTLVPAATNVREWYPGLQWSPSYFAPILSPALILSRLFRHFYAPTNSTIHEPAPMDEWTLLSRFFSTESMTVEDDGVTADKADKLFAISGWNETYDHLRVCYTKINGLENCCRCRKCLLTMTTLQMAGTLSRYKTFPLPLTRARVLRMNVTRTGPMIYDVRKKAQAVGRADVVRDLSLVLSLNRVRWTLKNARYKLRHNP